MRASSSTGRCLSVCLGRDYYMLLLGPTGLYLYMRRGVSGTDRSFQTHHAIYTFILYIYIYVLFISSQILNRYKAKRDAFLYIFILGLIGLGFLHNSRVWFCVGLVSCFVSLQSLRIVRFPFLISNLRHYGFSNQS